MRTEKIINYNGLKITCVEGYGHGRKKVEDCNKHIAVYHNCTIKEAIRAFNKGFYCTKITF